MGLSLRELAERVGLTASFLSRIERVLASPSIESLPKVSVAMGVPISHFLVEPHTWPRSGLFERLLVGDDLGIRPKCRADRERLIQVGGLLVGPCYVLSDAYRVTPETLIHNLMLGLRLAREVGASIREVCIPDAFGHFGYLPLILQGFGTGSAISWRGLGA